MDCALTPNSCASSAADTPSRARRERRPFATNRTGRPSDSTRGRVSVGRRRAKEPARRSSATTCRLRAAISRRWAADVFRSGSTCRRISLRHRREISSFNSIPMFGTPILRTDERARILDAEALHSNARLPLCTEAHSMRGFSPGGRCGGLGTILDCNSFDGRRVTSENTAFSLTKPARQNALKRDSHPCDRASWRGLDV